MVDSNDRDRVSEARDELHRMLNEVRGAPLRRAASRFKTFKTEPRDRARDLIKSDLIRLLTRLPPPPPTPPLPG